MSMRGVVAAINKNRGMVAIETDNGFTIIELLGDDSMEVGNKICWENDTGLGSETYQNISKGIQFEVYVQNHWVPEHQLRQQLLF